VTLVEGAGTFVQDYFIQLDKVQRQIKVVQLNDKLSPTPIRRAGLSFGPLSCTNP